MITLIIIVCTLINLTIITTAAGRAVVNKKTKVQYIQGGGPAVKPEPRSWPTQRILEEYAKVPESLRTEDVAGILEDLDRINGVREVTRHFRSNDDYFMPYWLHWKNASADDGDRCDVDDPASVCYQYHKVKSVVEQLVTAGNEQERLLKEQSPEYTQVKSLTERLEQNVEAIQEANKELEGR